MQKRKYERRFQDLERRERPKRAAASLRASTSPPAQKKRATWLPRVRWSDVSSRVEPDPQTFLQEVHPVDVDLDAEAAADPYTALLLTYPELVSIFIIYIFPKFPLR